MSGTLAEWPFLQEAFERNGVSTDPDMDAEEMRRCARILVRRNTIRATLSLRSKMKVELL